MLGALSTVFRFRKNRPVARRTRFSPRVESLESRDVPTGNVTASLYSGTLYLTGINDAKVLANNDQDIIITGGGLGTIIVQGQNDTSVNLGGGPVTYNGVKNISVSMNNGNDFVTVEGVQIAGNLYYTGAEGNDDFTIQNGSTTIDGILSISGGNGNNIAKIGFVEGDQVTVGTFTASNGTGFDATIVGGSDFTVIKNATVYNGNGGSDTEFAATASVTINGTTTITNGSGDDTVIFGDTGNTSVSLKNVTINNAAGQAITQFDGLEHTIAGNLSVTNGTGVGPDLFAALGDSFVVTGKFTENNGSGGSLTTFASNFLIEIDGATSITNYAGDDAVVFGNFGGTIALGSVTINNGADASDTFFQGADMNVFGNITVTNGTSSAGSDNFFVTGDTFSVLGTLTLNNGAGDTSTVIVPTVGSISGAFVLNNGTGLDDVALLGMGLVNTTLNLGSGGSTVAVNVGVQVVGNLTINAYNGDDIINLGGDVTGNVTVNTNNGFDQVIVNTLIVNGSASINTGNDDDVVSIDDSFFNGTFLANVGSGNDSIIIETLDTGVGSQFAKSVTMYLGYGDDSVTIGIDDDLDDHGVFLGTVYVDGSAGFDQYFAGPPKSNSFSINPSLPGWEVKV